MSRPIVPAGIEVVAKARQAGSDRLHVIHVSANDPTPSAAELQEAAEVLQSRIAESPDNWALGVEWISVTATDISQLDGQQYTATFSPPLATTRTGVPMPGNVALVTSFRSTHGGRVGHGRVYNFGLVSTDLGSNGTVLAAVAAMWTSFWSTTSAAYTTSGLPLCVFSRKNLALYPVQAVVTEQNLDSQRRRLIGRGS
jgi:hypothetical protein